MTKRLICVFAALLLACSPALAVYRGILTNSVATTFTLSNGVGLLPAAATICFLVPATKHSSLPNLICDALTAQPGGVSQLSLNGLPAGTTRVIVHLDVPNGGGTVTLQVSQVANGTNFQDQVNADSRFVYDVQ